MKYELHPACAAWPPMPDDEIAALAADIQTNGQRHPVTLHEEQILDGRNRALACERIGIEPVTQVYEGDDPIGFVVSVNLHRRHLTTKERSEIAAKLANLPHGGKPYRKAKLPFDSLTIERAAKLMNVSRRSVVNAKANLKPPRKAPKQDRARAIIRERGMGPLRQMEAEHGISLGSFQRAQIAEEARREALNELSVTINDLSPTAKQKFEILEKRLRLDMEVEIAKRAREEVEAILAKRDEIDAEIIRQANVLIEHSRGRVRLPFTAGEYTGVLLRALHPDTSTPEARIEAFKLINNKKLILRDDGPIKMRSSLAAPLPKTPEEWAAAKAAKQEERRQKKSDKPLAYRLDMP